jgi:hypothetical protein
MAAREDVIRLRVVLDMIGAQAHIQITHVHIAIRGIAIAVFVLSISFQANDASSHGYLDLSPDWECKEERKQQDR